MKRPSRCSTMLVCVPCIGGGCGIRERGGSRRHLRRSVVLNFSPPATNRSLRRPAPAATATGTGTITACVFPGGGATTGTFSYALAGNLTCSRQRT